MPHAQCWQMEQKIKARNVLKRALEVKLLEHCADKLWQICIMKWKIAYLFKLLLLIFAHSRWRFRSTRETRWEFFCVLFDFFAWLTYECLDFIFCCLSFEIFQPTRALFFMEVKFLKYFCSFKIAKTFILIIKQYF